MTEEHDRVGAAITACRNAVADYQAGVLDDRELRLALLEAAAVVETPSVHLDRVLRAAVALPVFSESALTQLRQSIDRLNAVPTRGRTP